MNSGPERDTKRESLDSLSAPKSEEVRETERKPATIRPPDPSELLATSFSSNLDQHRSQIVEVAQQVSPDRNTAPTKAPAAILETPTVVSRTGPSALQRLGNFVSKLLKNLFKRLLSLFGLVEKPTNQKLVQPDSATEDLEQEIAIQKKRKKKEQDEGFSGPGAI